MKAILIVDMPMMCCECKFFRFANNDDWGSSETICTINGKHCENGIDYKPRVCPLKPLPPSSKENGRYVREKCFTESLSENYLDYENGWNACLNEITGETE